MQYIIAVFKSRTESYSFINIMRSYVKNIKIIATPKELNMPCGISVAFDVYNYNIALMLISRRNFSSFSGMYKIIQTHNSIKILPAHF